MPSTVFEPNEALIIICTYIRAKANSVRCLCDTRHKCARLPMLGSRAVAAGLMALWVQHTPLSTRDLPSLAMSYA